MPIPSVDQVASKVFTHYLSDIPEHSNTIYIESANIMAWGCDAMDITPVFEWMGEEIDGSGFKVIITKPGEGVNLDDSANCTWFQYNFIAYSRSRFN